MDKTKKQIIYNGSIWSKYEIQVITGIKSNSTQVNVKFPDESVNWIWDYKLCEANKIITINEEKYTIDGFCKLCFDGIMKDGSTISVLPYNESPSA